MQKNIIALAIAAAFAAPAAALAADFYGSMDGGVRHQSNDFEMQSPGGAGMPPANYKFGGTTDSMAMGQYNTARWGFKSVEDLGDGMKTNVVLETSFFPKSVGVQGGKDMGGDNGNFYGLIFDRQATLGLSGGMGSFDMGWNYSLAWNSIIANDPFAGKFNDITYVKTATGSAASNPMTGFTNANANGVRSGNMTVATTFGDVKVAGQYVLNNSSSMTQPTTGAGRALSVNYASGAINVGGAYTAKEADAGKINKMTHMTVGGGYNFGDGKVSAGYAKKSVTTAASDDTDTTMWLGASYNMSTATAVTAAYYKNSYNSGATGAKDQDKNRMMAMVTYALSKKTTMYVEMDNETVVSTTTGVNDSKTFGTSVGLNANF